MSELTAVGRVMKCDCSTCFLYLFILLILYYHDYTVHVYELRRSYR